MTKVTKIIIELKLSEIDGDLYDLLQNSLSDYCLARYKVDPIFTIKKSLNNTFIIPAVLTDPINDIYYKSLVQSSLLYEFDQIYNKQKELKMDIEKEKTTSAIESHYAAIDAFVKSLIDKGVNPNEIVLEIQKNECGEKYSVRKKTPVEIHDELNRTEPKSEPILTLHRSSRGFLYLQTGEVILRLGQDVTHEDARNFVDVVNGIDQE